MLYLPAAAPSAGGRASLNWEQNEHCTAGAVWGRAWAVSWALPSLIARVISLKLMAALCLNGREEGQLQQTAGNGVIPTGRAKRARKVMAAFRGYPAASLLLWPSSILLHSDAAMGADSACKGLLALIFIFCMKSSPPQHCHTATAAAFPRC